MSKFIYAPLIVGASLCLSPEVMAAVKEYHLVIDQQQVNVGGKSLKKITVNGQFPAPLLEFEEGDEAVIHVENRLKQQDSSVHWHGILLPGLMDGVPGFNQFKGIAPQGHFEYRFKVRQQGTYWYHAHSKGQEQDGLYGPLVIYPRGHQPLAAHETTQRDYVVMLSDDHRSSGDQIMRQLKKDPEYYQNRRETLSDVWRQVKMEGLKATWQQRSMWNQMRMLRTDLSDVSGYTFLINGKTPEQNWTGLFKPNEKLRLRFINASAMSFFDVRIPNLKMTVVSADGQPVKPVSVDEFRIGTAETYDVIVEPQAGHYQIEAESIDRSGFAVGTLHNENLPLANGIHPPQPRPRALLTLQDMGMAHEGHANHDEYASPSQPKAAAAATTDAHQHAAQSDAAHEKPPADAGMSDTAHMNMHQQHHPDASTVMQPMNMPPAAMQHSMPHEMPVQQMQHHEMQKHSEHAQHSAAETLTTSQPNVEGWVNASTPAGHKALQYQDLKALHPQTDTRPAERELEIRLGGNMERYIWTINGKKFNEAEPLRVAYGERIRLKFINDSMMAHPMHLHGMFMQLENGQPLQDLPNKHTIVVPPGQTVSALLTADELGEWAIHCHLLYHMSAGMMNKLIVAKVDERQENANPVAPAPAVQGDQHAHH